MTAYKIPAPDAPSEEWGRLAVSLPGWRWMPGMLGRLGAGRLRVTLCGAGQLSGLRMGGQVVWSDDGVWPDPDDPATEGCLLRLLGRDRTSVMYLGDEDGLCSWYDGETWDGPRLPLGRACIAAAEVLGRWPGGDL